MNNPLQPELRPMPPWLARVLMLGGLILAMLVLGLLSQYRHRPAQLLLTDGQPYHAASVLERRFDAARARIWVTMYVVRCDIEPDQAPSDDPVAMLLRSLAAAQARGIDVRVCLDYGRDRETGEIEEKHTLPHAWLTKRGVRVVLDEETVTSHAKVMLIDDRWVIIGSHNWTRYALTKNREASVLLDDPAMAERLEKELFGRIPGWK